VASANHHISPLLRAATRADTKAVLDPLEAAMVRHVARRSALVVLAILLGAGTSQAAPTREANAQRRPPSARRSVARPRVRHAVRPRAVAPKKRSAPRPAAAVLAASNVSEPRVGAPVEGAPLPAFDWKWILPKNDVARRLPPLPLGRQQTSPLMTERLAPSLSGTNLSLAPVIASDQAMPPDRLNLLGVIEAPSRDVRIAVLSINNRIVRGRAGDVVGERYRIDAFTDRSADVIDVATHDVISVVPASTPDIPVVPVVLADASAPPAPTQSVGALRVVGEPASAEIYVDGEYVGTVDDMSGGGDGVSLEAGSHQVDIQAADYQPVHVAVRISPNRTTTYRVALPKGAERGQP